MSGLSTSMWLQPHPDILPAFSTPAQLETSLRLGCFLPRYQLIGFGPDRVVMVTDPDPPLSVPATLSIPLLSCPQPCYFSRRPCCYCLSIKTMLLVYLHVEIIRSFIHTTETSVIILIFIVPINQRTSDLPQPALFSDPATYLSGSTRTMEMMAVAAVIYLIVPFSVSVFCLFC